MAVHDSLSAFLLLMLIASICVLITSRLGLGSLIGLLLTGLIFGSFGIVDHAAAERLREGTELGVVFLLFVIGLELQPARLWSMRRTVLGFGSLQLIVTGLAVAAYSILAGARVWQRILLMALGIPMSSTALVMQILQDRGETETELGRSAFGILLFQDLAVVPALALIPVLAGPQAEGPPGRSMWMQLLILCAIFAAVVLATKFLVPYAYRLAVDARSDQAFAAITFVVALGGGWAMEQGGASMAMGAFVAGVALSGSPFHEDIKRTIEPFRDFLLSLFFIAVGMSMDLGLLTSRAVSLIVGVLSSLVIKTFVVYFLARLFGQQRPAAIRLALLLSQCGEFGFVLAGAAFGAGILPPINFAMVILLISVSMATTPMLLKLGDALAARLEAGSAASAAKSANPAAD